MFCWLKFTKAKGKSQLYLLINLSISWVTINISGFPDFDLSLLHEYLQVTSNQSMPKLKKSELKKHLLHSVQIFRVSLDYTVYCYFILAVLFSYHIGEGPYRYSHKLQISRNISAHTSLPNAAFQRKRKGLQNELTETFTSIETEFPPLKGVLLPAIPDTLLSDEELLEYQDQLDQLQ
jgi:hypothetical protein